MRKHDGIMAVVVWIAWLVLGICNIYADGKLPIDILSRQRMLRAVVQTA